MAFFPLDVGDSAKVFEEVVDVCFFGAGVYGGDKEAGHSFF